MDHLGHDHKSGDSRKYDLIVSGCLEKVDYVDSDDLEQKLGMSCPFSLRFDKILKDFWTSLS